MTIYQIYYPTIESSVRFKTLTVDEANVFVEKYKDLPKLEYSSLVLETCVYNLKTDVMLAVRKMSAMASDDLLTSLYNGCIMLNPTLDVATWMSLTGSFSIFHQTDMMVPSTKDLLEVPKQSSPLPVEKKKKPVPSPYTLSQTKFSNLEKYLNEKIVGQSEAIHEVVAALKRAHTMLNDPDRPICVFLFTGPSGVGKTLIAKELQKYLFESSELVRIDCGEYQQKHENQKLIGSASGYVGYEDGGQLTKAIAASPNTVLLIDEAEKAHADFWHTFLKVFDDGYLTDNKGNKVSFRNTIIIITSNLGNDKVAESTYNRSAGFTNAINNQYKSSVIPSRSLVERETSDAIRKFFKPELINRLDDVVIFNYLSSTDYRKIAELEMMNIADKLSKQQYDLSWNEDALDLLSSLSTASIEGARGMSKVRRDLIENKLADLLFDKKHPKGTIFNVTVQNNEFVIT